MSEPIPASISIWGKISRDKVGELAEAIVEQGAGPDWNESFRNAEEATSWLMDQIMNERTVIVFDYEANYGNLDDVVKFCKDNGLSFILHNDARYEYDAGSVYWDPKTRKEKAAASDQQGNTLIDIVPLQQALDKPDKIALDEIRKLVEQHSLPDPGPLILT